MALSDVLVVDLTHVVAGPMATKILRDLGARVIKVESPNPKNPRRPGDVTRYFQPLVETSEGAQSGYFATLNSGKESVVLNLDQPGPDRALLEAMLARADVLVENFRPGVLEALGYGWDVLHSRYPRLIVASLSGFGQTGPYSHRKAVDTIIQGMSGFITSTGFQDAPVKVGTTVSDLLAGVYCATGTLAALHRRSVEGVGSRVDIAMLDASFAFHAREFATYSLRQSEPPRMGNTSPIGVYPFDVFECRGGELFSVNAAGDEEFASFCGILGAPSLAQDERFRRSQDRWTNMKELKQAITAETGRWGRDALLEECLKLRGSGSFPIGPVSSFADIASDPQLAHRAMSRRSADGRFVIMGNPIKIAGCEASSDLTAPNPPALDADGAQLRREFLGSAPSKL